jgi:RNA recognition motif-containing protein
MSRHYSAGKRQREQDRSRKKREKAERRAQKRDRSPGDDMPMATVEEITGVMPSIEEAMQAIEERGSVASREAAATLPARLFVGGLSRDTTEADLVAAFSQYGPVIDAFLVKDRDTGESRGFGFATMKDRKDAPKAIEELNDSELNGRTIVVNVATERPR